MLGENGKFLSLHIFQMSRKINFAKGSEGQLDDVFFGVLTIMYCENKKSPVMAIDSFYSHPLH